VKSVIGSMQKCDRQIDRQTDGRTGRIAVAPHLTNHTRHQTVSVCSNCIIQVVTGSSAGIAGEIQGIAYTDLDIVQALI